MKTPTTIEEFSAELIELRKYMKSTRQQKELCCDQIQYYTEEQANSIIQHDKLQAIEHKIQVNKWESNLLKLSMQYADILNLRMDKVVQFRKDWETRMRQQNPIIWAVGLMVIEEVY